MPFFVHEMDSTKEWFQVTLAKGKNIKMYELIETKWHESEQNGKIKDLWACVNKDNLYRINNILTVRSGHKLLMTASEELPLNKIIGDVVVWFLVHDNKPAENLIQTPPPVTNAFTLMMARKGRKYVPTIEVKNNKDRLYNDVTKKLHDADLKVDQDEMRNAKILTTCLTNCLWAIDANIDKIRDSSQHGKCKKLPHMFDSIYDCEYNNYREKKVAKLVLSAEKLKFFSDKLYDIISTLHRKNVLPSSVSNASLELAVSLRSYSDYLMKSSEIMSSNRANIEAPRSVEKSIKLPLPFASVPRVAAQYTLLDEIMSHADFYEAIFMDNDVLAGLDIPTDRRKRFQWFKDIGLSCRVQLYQYCAGGQIGNISFLWKIPNDDVDQTRTHQVVTQISKHVPQYETRLIAKQVRERYSSIVKFSPVVRRNFVNFVTGKIQESKGDIDNLFNKFISLPDDGDEKASVIYDHRIENGREKNQNFENFWNELDKMLEELGKAAEERRKTMTAHLPFAISVPDLIRKVKSRLEDKGIDSSIPSTMTVRYQFMPPHGSTKTASSYKGRFDVVCKVQRRQIRKHHEDAHYVNSYFLNLRSWCVANKENCDLVFMDDKAKVPVGEPGTPEAATSHTRKSFSKSNVVLEASDHNYHSVNITPSVTLACDIPDNANDSFYTGQIFVSLKDSVFDGSDALRHSVELMKVLDLMEGEKKPFLSIFTDGGADHNIKHIFVQCCLLALFRIADLDILNVGRCAPYHSYTNPAERCMSLLNLGLQGVSLERDDAGCFEKQISSCKSMNGIRQAAPKVPGLKEAFQASVEAPRKTLENVFSCLELKGKQVSVFKAARDHDLIVKALRMIEPLIQEEADIPHRLTKLPDYPALQMFLEQHMKDGLYLLQFRKCEDLDCCIRTIQNLPPYIPAPLLDPTDDGHYMKFENLYGKLETSEKDCPSLNGPKSLKKPPGFKFLASRVVAAVKCSLCSKPRCVYSINNTLGVKGQIILDELIYSCGSEIPSQSLYTSNLTCQSFIEHSYYATKFATKLVCIHCGVDDIREVSYRKKLQVYKTVFPSCTVCLENGKEEIVVESSRRTKPVAPKTKERANAAASSTADTNAHTDVDVDFSFEQPPAKKQKQSKIVFKPLTETEDHDDGAHDDEACTICHKEDDDTNTHKVIWVDCDTCKAWAHKSCATEHGWMNLRRRSWLCTEHR